MIDRHRKLDALFQDFPEAREVVREHGINCAECIAVSMDTLADVFRMYNLDGAALEREMTARIQARTRP